MSGISKTYHAEFDLPYIIDDQQLIEVMNIPVIGIQSMRISAPSPEQVHDILIKIRKSLEQTLDDLDKSMEE